MLFIVLPPLGALIGWITNVLAVRYLFRPRCKLRIFGVTIWGIVPRYRAELAQAIAGAVADKLFTAGDVASQLAGTNLGEHVLATAMESVETELERKLSSMPSVVSRVMISGVNSYLQSQGPDIIDRIIVDVVDTVSSRLDIATVVKQRVQQFPLAELERLTYSVVGRELRMIEALGASVGFVVGLVQAGILTIVG